MVVLIFVVFVMGQVWAETSGEFQFLISEKNVQCAVAGSRPESGIQHSLVCVRDTLFEKQYILHLANG